MVNGYMDVLTLADESPIETKCVYCEMFPTIQILKGLDYPDFIFMFN